MWHNISSLKIAEGAVLFIIYVYFQYKRMKRSIVYYKRDRTAEVQTLFDGEK